MLEQNNVVLTGEIVKLDKPFKNHGMLFYKAILAVSRLSGIDDFIRITYQSSLVENELQVGETVEIKGSIRMYCNDAYVLCYALRREEGLLPSNDVCLQGLIHKKPNLRVTRDGTDICNFTMEVKRNFEHKDFIPVIAWNTIALTLNRYNVDTEINIWGRLQSRDYFMTDADGYTEVKRTVLEVSITSFRVVESEE